MGERFLDDDPPGGLEGWREVWKEDRRFRPGTRGGAFRTWLRKLLRSASREDAERQRNFNLAVLELLEDRQRELPKALEELARQLRAERDALVDLAVDRSDALLGAVDRKVETALARVRDLANPILDGAGVPALPPGRQDWLYRRMEEGLRGSDAEVREALAPYVEFARHSPPAIDAGCGRGEFLELCRNAGIPCRGYDTNERSVADARARGLDAFLGAIPDCFREHPDGRAGSILVSHVVEHLPLEALIALFSEARRVLRPGGYLMIETPNAEALAVSASEFWRDPTHLGPRHLAALVLLGREYGFDLLEAKPVHPFPEAETLQVPSNASAEVRHLVEQLNERLYGGRDLRVVLVSSESGRA
jgi:SAM-dependent methyltransferase